jgi:hypothetical protein
MNDPKRPKLKPEDRYFLARTDKGEQEYLTKLVPMTRDKNPGNARALHGDFLNETRWNWHQQGNVAITETEMRVRVKQWNAAKSRRQESAHFERSRREEKKSTQGDAPLTR